MARKTKAVQVEINKIALTGMKLWEEAHQFKNREKLGNAYAEIWYLDNNCIALMSCGTFVAIIDKGTGFLYDLLRYMHHYTPTCAKHIAKFRTKFSDYIIQEYRYYPV